MNFYKFKGNKRTREIHKEMIGKIFEEPVKRNGYWFFKNSFGGFWSKVGLEEQWEILPENKLVKALYGDQ